MRILEKPIKENRFSAALKRCRGSVLVLFAASALMTVFSGCNPPGNEYSEYRHLPESGWRFNEPVAFAPVHPDSIARGFISVAVRHDNTYPYRALWLELSYKGANGVKRDTICLDLADDYGRWMGKGIGTSFQLADTLASPMTHVSGDSLVLRHIMRTDTLRGLNSIGLFFNP